MGGNDSHTGHRRAAPAPAGRGGGRTPPARQAAAARWRGARGMGGGRQRVKEALTAVFEDNELSLKNVTVAGRAILRFCRGYPGGIPLLPVDEVI